MYGPSKGDMQFILTLAAIGGVAIVATFVVGAIYVLSHIALH